MSRLFGIAGVQMAVVPWDAQATVKKIQDSVHQISLNFPWVDMIIFHELAAPGLVQFVPADKPAGWRKNAESIPGPLTDVLCDIARRHRKWLVPGSLYEVDGDLLYNTAVVISPLGELIAKYRKMFPWLPFEAGTTAGDEFCVFDVPYVGRFGLSICYDTWFPETVRTLAWMGAEVIIHPTMTPTSDRELELILNQANAIFNQCYFIDINGVGPWGGGRSLIVDPDGRVLQKAGESETILTEIIDLDNVKKAREFGNLGLSQLWKQLKEHPRPFPIYENGISSGKIYEDLGELKFHRKLAID
jgi:formamidase